MHRVVLVFRMPQLMIIDGIPVTDEERNKAEMYFADQMPVSAALSLTTCLVSLYRNAIKSGSVT